MEIILEFLRQIDLSFVTDNFIFSLIKKYFSVALQHYIGNPWMKIVLAFMPALIGIAYPLIVQTVSRLDEKYNSSHIVAQFKKEPLHNYFILNLKISVILTLLTFIFSVTIFFLAFLSLCSLLYLFFKYLMRLLEYQNSNDLFQHLLSRINFDSKQEKNKILDLWSPIVDIYKYSIVVQDKYLEGEIRYNYFYKVFHFITTNDQKDKELIKFPTQINNGCYDIISTYLNNLNPDYYSSIEAFVGSSFFPHAYDDEQKQFLHEDTLHAIWRNIILLVEHESNDKILRFWAFIHQYTDFDLKIPYAKFDDNYDETKESIDTRKKIERYRKTMIQFSTVLGAYLMYKRNFKSLHQVWNFTQSQPPRYTLMPLSMNQIFGYYFTFLATYMDESDIPLKYWFKDLDFDEMNGRTDVKFMVRKYACLLFLRQWIIDSSYGKDPLSFPSIPATANERDYWLNRLDFFKSLVEKHLADEKLMKNLGLEIITKKYCESKHQPFPLDYIDEFKKRIEQNDAIALLEAELEEEKITKLDDYTIDLIGKTYQSFQRVAGPEVKENNRDSISDTMQAMRGSRILFDKKTFLSEDDSGTTILFYDEILAQDINDKYFSHISVKFYLNAKIRYSVPHSQMFDAIDKLDLKEDQHVIVAFKINFSYLREYQNVPIIDGEGELNYTYKSIPIYSFNKCHPSASKALYILNRNDLPMIKHKDYSEIEGLPNAAKQRWESMESIRDELKLYRRTQELNKSVDLRNEYIENGKTEEEVKNKVEVDIDFIGNCWFKKGVKIVEIKESDKFQEGGIKDQLSNIKPFGS